MIRSKIQEKVAKALDTKLTDAAQRFTCTKLIQSGAFDWKTQTYPDSIEITYTGRGVVSDYKKQLVKPTDYQADDAKLIALQNEVLLNGVEHKPEIGDMLTFADGDYTIIDIKNDPVAATYTIQIRKAVM